MLICLSCQMLGQEVSQSDECISNQAFLMRLAQILLHHLAPLLRSPYIIEACCVPLLESLCKVTSVSGLSMNETPHGKKHRLMLFLDMMFAFLEVSSFIVYLFLIYLTTLSILKVMWCQILLLWLTQ